jgi:endonuclease G
MATVFVIHAEGDTPFLKQRVLRSLPSNGYDCWLAGSHFAGAKSDAIAQAMDQCQAILMVLSSAIFESPTSSEEIDIALASRRTLVVVQIAAFDKREAARLPTTLWALPKVDFTMEEGEEAERLLVAMLPPVVGKSESMVPEGAERIEWNEEIFSAALARATARHDHSRAKSLVKAIVSHLVHRPDVYPSKHASNDLQRLRQEREFELMRRYAEAVIASGARQDKIRRLFGQALIETGQYGRALEVLQSIIDDTDSSDSEVFEAQGLIGRTFKQRYMDAPNAAGAAELLRRAIAAYEAAYLEKQSNFWHGVNAASCILRAERDGIDARPPGRAQEIARQIVEQLDRLSQKGPLEVWDCASRVEALLALGRYDEAEHALDVYINHPEMQAFEVSSTFRQYDQVLQLDRDPRGAVILARLRDTMERYRAGKVEARAAATPGTEKALTGRAVTTKSLVIRLGDPAWEPQGVTDLVIQSRLGNIVTARGSDASIRKLLEDSTVISVDEGRPAGQIECDRSVPFINAVAHNTPAPATYKETGDRALIAVIDNGIDVLHNAFLDAAGKSRIVGIWDQTATGGTPPQGFSYGAFHDEAAIAGYVAARTVPPSLGRNERGHGTHVASIAGGRAAGNFAGGVAPDAKLLIVVSGGGGLIGSVPSHLEALDFIDAFATKLDLPVVVNMSEGMNAGAHDGKSPLEVAFDAFSKSGTRQGRVVVKSAGNERNKHGHARVIMKRDSKHKLRWRRRPGAEYNDRIELWWNSANDIEFQLGEPVKSVDVPLEHDLPANWSGLVGTATPECEGVFPKGGPFRLVFTKRHVVNGESLLVIELGNATGAAGLGDWLLQLRSVTLREGGEVHCWIERSLGVPTSFLISDENMTLSIPGTARSVITVGAVDACRPIEEGEFSSYGPPREEYKQPLVCAPGVKVRAALGGTDEDVFPDDGTSMAAGFVSGAIALLLSQTEKVGNVPSGNQIAAVLRQKAQNYDGNWHPGQGYGLIDVTALLAAFP